MLKFNDFLKEAELSAKQKKIAKIAGDKDKIDADDLAALRAGKKPVDECDYGKMKKEDLVGNQYKLDKNKNGKIDSDDLKQLRGEGVLKPELEKGFPARGVKTGASAPKGTTYMPKKDVKEETDKHNIYHEMEKHGETYLHHHDSYDHDDRDVDRYYIKKQDHHRDAAEDALKKGNKKEMHAHLAQFYKHAGEAHDYAGRDDESAEASELEHHHHKLAGGTHVKEEVEQIDELSKKTLGSYVNKAAKDSRIHGQIATDFENTADKARKQSKRDSFERLNRKYLEKAWKREAGISKAVDKLTKEEAEQIDELSRDTLVSYVGKREDQLLNKLKKGGLPFKKASYGDKDALKTLNQHKSTMVAQRKIAKKNDNAYYKEETELDEGRMKDLAYDLDNMGHDEFHKQYGKPKSHFDPTNFKKPVQPGHEMERAKELAQRGMKSLSKEEVERVEEKLAQLDEISKKTAGSYVKGRVDDLTDKSMDDDSHEHSHIKAKHMQGIDRAAKRLGDKNVAKHAKAAVDHAKDFAWQYHHNMDDYHAVHAQDNMDDSKAKLSKAVDKASKKHKVKEEVEQEQSPYLKATLAVMDEGKIDDLRDAQKIRQAEKSAYDKDYKPDTSHPAVKVHKGTAYGGSAQKDDETDEKPETKEKRSPGRPSGTSTGARLKGSKKIDKDVDGREYTLHLPK